VTAIVSPSGLVRYGQPAGRWVLLATVLGSALAFIDATVVNIALPRIAVSFGTDAAALQWTINGYTLSLASLILLGGSLGDRFGRRKIFVTGVIWFAVASLLCGLAPSIGVLIAARVLQGVGGALLTPGALAILEASFIPATAPGPLAPGPAWPASAAHWGLSWADGWSRSGPGGSSS
jgi:MFS family permease